MGNLLSVKGPAVFGGRVGARGGGGYAEFTPHVSGFMVDLVSMNLCYVHLRTNVLSCRHVSGNLHNSEAPALPDISIRMFVADVDAYRGFALRELCKRTGRAKFRSGRDIPVSLVHQWSRSKRENLTGHASDGKWRVNDSFIFHCNVFRRYVSFAFLEGN